jgi:hypothetical protein
MPRLFLTVLLFSVAFVHAVGGSSLADGETATLMVLGAGATTRWIAKQLLGASIAGYAVGGLATLGIAAPASWRIPGIALGALASLALAGILWRTAAWPAVLATADAAALLAAAAIVLRPAALRARRAAFAPGRKASA